MMPMAGGIILVDYENDESYLYGHVGVGTGYSNGCSGAVGLVKNYEEPNDYAGEFLDYNIGYNVGIDYCRNPDMSMKNPPSAYSLTFGSKLNLGKGRDWYTSAIPLLDW